MSNILERKNTVILNLMTAMHLEVGTGPSLKSLFALNAVHTF